jgi:hypothetical protein
MALIYSLNRVIMEHVRIPDYNDIEDYEYEEDE